jgi:hypothetical protein
VRPSVASADDSQFVYDDEDEQDKENQAIDQSKEPVSTSFLLLLLPLSSRRTPPLYSLFASRSTSCPEVLLQLVVDLEEVANPQTHGPVF